MGVAALRAFGAFRGFPWAFRALPGAGVAGFRRRGFRGRGSGVMGRRGDVGPCGVLVETGCRMAPRGAGERIEP